MDEQLTGTIDQIVFYSEETGFCVAKLKSFSKDLATCITGNFEQLHPGEEISCFGKWTHHPSYGRQFSVDRYELKAPQDAKGIEKYLESGMIKGIGRGFAKKIVKTFKEKTLDVIDNHPERLLTIEGIGEKRLEKLITSWKEQKKIRTVMIFLRTHNIALGVSHKIFKKFGDDSINILQTDPYVMAREIRGVGFKTADKIAQTLGISLEDPKRISCAIEYFMHELTDEGHTCYPQKNLLEKVAEFIGVSEDLIKKELLALIQEGRMVLEEIEKGLPFVWLKSYYATEKGIAEELYRLSKGESMRPQRVEETLSWAEKKLSIIFAPEQREAVIKSLKHPLSIITGGPGTGKSTITHAIVSIFSELSENVLLAAPTGKAAKRMSEINKKKAFTIHSLLEYDFIAKSFKRNRLTPLECDLIIIDEASMLDSFLMLNLLKAIPTDAKVVFIGDVDQLPSVGAGNILKDMIASLQIPTAALKEIYRQAKGSQIITNAHKINQGLFPSLQNHKEGDFVFIHKEDPTEIAQEILSLVKTRLPNKKFLDPIEDIQVLSPMRKGVIGIENLNHLLQKELNPSLIKLERMGRTFLLGDKVMQIRNNYTKNVFNGDVGIIKSINFEDQELIISFDQKEVEYEFHELDEVVLAYACSIHKYQGSECPCVIIPIHTSHFKLLYRNLLYTGITRGKKLVILVGSKRAVAIAVKNEQVLERHTGLIQAVEKRFCLAYK
jgi:exodeoxyribonuclease V alpha subunit